MSDVSANVAVVQDVYAAFARGDVPAVTAALAPDVEWVVPSGSPYGGVHRTPGTVVQRVLAPLAAEWDGWHMAVDRILDAGDHVVALGTEGGTHRASGRTVRALAAHVFVVRDGRVARFTDYVDTHAVARAT
jgi:ketosteroid isomerase-like protein